jgi:hypothetical protein
MKKYKIAALGLFSVMLLIGCKGQVSVDEAYNAIRPVKQLELPDQVDENLVIIIENVADETSSYKNTLDLYINDHKINPDWLVSNVQNKYVYKMRMRPGYYELRGSYNAYVGWGEDKYEIISEDLIRVQHDKRTVVTAEIVKKPNGEPVNKTMYFSSKLEELGSKRDYGEKKANPSSTVNDMITLQINTVPEHAQVIVDDKVVGQSPLRYEVSRSTDHVVQISAEGYRTKTKFIDRAKMGSRDVYLVVQELERE